MGDLTVLQLRGFLGGLMSTPFIVTDPLDGVMTTGLQDNRTWGMEIVTLIYTNLRVFH